MFRKAERKKAKLRLAITGSSGSGKTLGALKIAKGIGGKIAMIDTESGSGELYSHIADYDVLQLTPPYSPERYIKAIKQAESLGYEILIIDSLTPAWAGEGGVLEMVDKVTKASKSKNSYTAWGDVTPHQNKLIDSILASSMHVIATMRSKTAYDLVENNGKKTPVKIGLAPIQREGLDYEFTIVFDISIDGHVASASKDRTTEFDGKYFVIDEDIGKKLINWLNSGADVVAREEIHEGDNKETWLSNIQKAENLQNLKKMFESVAKSPLFRDELFKAEVIYAKDERKNKLIEEANKI